MSDPWSDTLTVTFDSALKDESGICISRRNGDDIKVLKMELGEQADILYYLLTNQSSKAEIKEYSEYIPDWAKEYDPSLSGKLNDITIKNLED